MKIKAWLEKVDEKIDEFSDKHQRTIQIAGWISLSCLMILTIGRWIVFFVKG